MNKWLFLYIVTFLKGVCYGKYSSLRKKYIGMQVIDDLFQYKKNERYPLAL